jgi:signal transduction histidine kinase
MALEPVLINLVGNTFKFTDRGRVTVELADRACLPRHRPGLTISRQLCQLLGYRRGLHGEVGQGSTFSISLRAA